MQIVEAASRFSAEVSVRVVDKVASARSPFELMMLTATQGSKVTVSGMGDDAAQAVDAVVRLIESGFGENA